MTENATEIDLESLWNESTDDGELVSTDPITDEPQQDDSDAVEDEVEEEAEPEEAEETEEETESQDEIDYKALYEKAQHEVKTQTGRLKAVEARLKQENEQLAGKLPPEPVAPTEEDEFLQKFRTEYSDDVIKAIDLITTRKASQLIDSTLAGRLAPIEQQTYDIVAQAHFGAIEAAHPDVDEINASPEFEAWLDSRPTHVKGAYAYVREQGTPAEVISMLNEYKGALRPQTKTPSTVPKERVAAATAVTRRRGTAQSAAAPDPNDLEAIWNETDD